MAIYETCRDHSHWGADWLDVTALQHGLDTLFAAEHRDTDVFVAIVRVCGPIRGPLVPEADEDTHWRREVRPRQGAPVIEEESKTYHNAPNPVAIERTEEWLEEHRYGLESHPEVDAE